MRLFPVLLVVLHAACLPLGGPPVTSGVVAGGVCGASLDCDPGLVCECGACTTPSSPPRPALCDGVAPDGCPLRPTDCVSDCVNGVILTAAVCTGGVETCATGVLATSCVCPFPPPSGWFCDEEVVTCFDEAPDGFCRVSGCADPARICLPVCGSLEREPEECVQASPDDVTLRRCREPSDLIDERDCGACAGLPPTCLNGCNILDQVGTARCDDLSGAYVCDDGVIDTECACEPALPPRCVDATTCGNTGLAVATCNLVTDDWECAVGAREDECIAPAEGEGEGEGEGEPPPSCPGLPTTCNGVDRVPCLKACDPDDAPLPCGAACRDGAWNCSGFPDYVPANQCPG